ncbi:hypothetical protein N7501_009480 [Penicillium viridicatum]|nr:hypothetical protein N7501_009480 [Penicillium viridicatum]
MPGARLSRVRHAVDYSKERVTIRGSDGVPVELTTALAPIECLDELLVICVDEGVDNILQRVIDDTDDGEELSDQEGF